MRKYFTKLGLAGLVLASFLIGGSIVVALPPQANTHAQTPGRPSNPGSQANTNRPSNPGSQSSTKLAAAQLKSCQNRENAINNIISHINTRTQNQLTLFSTIANRVEAFYTNSSKTVSNYSQLTGAISNAKAQTQTDLAAMQSNSSFSCSSDNPKGMVTAFQGYMKTEIADLQAYRTAVKNLIVALAQANGVTLSNSAQGSDQPNASKTQGGQQ